MLFRGIHEGYTYVIWWNMQAGPFTGDALPAMLATLAQARGWGFSGSDF